jgi:hypothetical protein
VPLRLGEKVQALLRGELKKSVSNLSVQPAAGVFCVATIDCRVRCSTARDSAGDEIG